MHTERISEIIKDSISVKEQILNNPDFIKDINKITTIITNCYKNGGKVLLCGNGGSASDAQHIAAELTGRFYLDRKPLNAEALHVNGSYITAVSNDYGYDVVFSRMLEAKAVKGDVLIGLSTSGNSKTVVNAVLKAKEIGVNTIGFLGGSGGELKELVDISLLIPSSDTPRIQEAHILIGHILCELIENNLFGTDALGDR